MQRSCACLGLLLLAAACGGDPARIGAPRPDEPAPERPALASLTVTPDTGTLAPGDSLRLIALPRDAAGAFLDDVTIAWSTSDTTRAVVSPSGWVFARQPGSIIVSARASGFTARAFIAVASAGFVAVVAGGYHTCGITPDQLVRCWGLNQYGELGIGTPVAAQGAPAPVAGGRRLAPLALSGHHTCGLSPGGSLTCWGWNMFGQVGDGTTVTRYEPRDVGMEGFLVAVAAGGHHSCALDGDGRAYCWGRNLEGQIGDGSFISRSRPTPVSSDRRFVTLTAGARHTCALTEDAAAWCWGGNAYGQLGDGSTTARAIPVPVGGNLTFLRLSAGYFHTCGASSGGQLYCWGANLDGQLGLGTASAGDSLPRSLPSSLSAGALAAGGHHTCALDGDDRAWCWGRNAWGQLGDGTLGDRAFPRRVAGELEFATLSAGVDHTCGMTRTGLALCWGLGIDGELGQGTWRSSPTPIRVAGQP